MIKVSCYICSKELDDPGSLFFGPPDRHDRVNKLHICISCTTDVKGMLNARRLELEYIATQQSESE